MVKFSIDRALELLESAVEGLRVVPPIPVGQRVVIKTDDDEPDEPAVLSDEAESSPRGLFIIYRASDGAVSQRRITVRQLLGHPPELMLAYCHERRAPRNFRFDRIVEAIDPVTGEVLALAGLAAALAADLGVIDLRLRRAINTLVFLMRCDGTAHPLEWAAIDEVLANYMVRFGGDDADHRRACKMARQVAPDSADLLIAMRSFAAAADRDQLRSWLEPAVLTMINADGAQREAEFEWLLRISEFLKIMTPRNAEGS